MKTAHEILLDDELDRRSRAAEARQVDRLVAAANVSLLVPISLVAGWSVFLVVIFVSSASENLLRYLAFPGVLWLLALGQLIAEVLRKQRALRQLIREEAPDFHARLDRGRPHRWRQAGSTRRPV